MRFLITNDDGIDAEGIKLLVEWASKHGEVTVAAPEIEQSGKSHGIELAKPIKVKKVDFPGAVQAYAVSSTPADCVRFAVIGLKQKYDIVLSGINKGYNIGYDIAYSGTVGAVFEANHVGHKAVALSTDYTTLKESQKSLDEVFEFLQSNKLLNINPIYNINIPKDAKGIRITRQGNAYYSDEFVPCGEGEFMQQGYYVSEPDYENKELDTVTVAEGMISITPLHHGVTDEITYKKLTEI